MICPINDNALLNNISHFPIVITIAGMEILSGCAIPFALEIVRSLLGDERAAELEATLQ